MLFVRNNLNDVDNINAIRCILKLGDVIDLSSDKVKVEGGTITINNFVLNDYSATKSKYIKCMDSYGMVTLVDDIKADWIRYDRKEISIDIFENDIGALMKYEVDPNMYIGDYKNMKNSVNLSDLNTEQLTLNYAANDLNMADCVLDDVQGILGLSLYSSCNLGDSFKGKNVRLGNVRYELVGNKQGVSLLTEKNTLLFLSNFPYSTKFIYGRGQLMNDIIDEYTELLLPTSKYMEYFIEILEDEIRSKTNIVRQYVGDLVNTIDKFKSIYLSEFEYLLDAMNLNDVRKNLGLNRLYDYLYIDDESLEIELIKYEFFQRRSKLIFKNIKRLDELSARGFLYFTENNEYHYTLLEEFNVSSINEYGICKLETLFYKDMYTSNDVTFNISYYIYNSRKTFENMSTVINGIEGNVENVLLANRTDNPRDVLLLHRSNLSELNIVDNFSLIYENLGIHIVGYDANYNNLNNTPIALSSFSNNIPYLEMRCNLEEITAFAAEARNILMMGSIATQNIHNVDLIGKIFNMDFLSVESALSIIENADEGRLLTPSGWSNLYEYDIENKEKDGILRMNTNIVLVDDLIDVYLSVDSDENSTYSTQILKEFEKLINHELDALLSEIQYLRDLNVN